MNGWPSHRKGVGLILGTALGLVLLSLPSQGQPLRDERTIEDAIQFIQRRIENEATIQYYVGKTPASLVRASLQTKGGCSFVLTIQEEQPMLTGGVVAGKAVYTKTHTISVADLDADRIAGDKDRLQLRTQGSRILQRDCSKVMELPETCRPPENTDSVDVQFSNDDIAGRLAAAFHFWVSKCGEKF